MSYSNLEDLDPETARLIIQLQLDDLQEIKDQSKGKAREEELTDPDLSLELCSAELTRSADILRDTSITRSIATAIYSDQEALREFLKSESRACQDRQLACHPDEMTILPKELPALKIHPGKASPRVTYESSPPLPAKYQKQPWPETLGCGICSRHIHVFESPKIPNSKRTIGPAAFPPFVPELYLLKTLKTGLLHVRTAIQSPVQFANLILMKETA
ncbi:hypothetical protein H112_07449 [Trichophyton rubrum D6]|uniref:Uncharacterized protein n=5 Tax=Trichophyton TaxID=5550 RepID=A0A178EUN3_TRIRU|nr:uncharacterized protein TERG_00056 [Trichophyton rubrum CBS 118892]EZF11433.1 hypothetical protein H100_07475 [Trichophyton rubrum MR850]EZF38278.1 hypothetical protein H102_07439 [Trichophyton rubrum CBS 100081]EZF48895.1 hypothetical protein H103_07463 [Trichophyton rubrum CBS 288.86]EZF59544.1 hypothetical protein H104_07411 [Trichophyton rubrum CBS 289.86]EZF70180.1 hypothetical protein H105_07469 [Trichophyton soudanense CBS 452.61]EZF80778.1 hypothetical protein H110_07458 [Trichophy